MLRAPSIGRFSATPLGSGSLRRQCGGIAALNPRLISGKPPACSVSNTRVVPSKLTSSSRLQVGGAKAFSSSFVADRQNADSLTQRLAANR